MPSAHANPPGLPGPVRPKGIIGCAAAIAVAVLAGAGLSGWTRSLLLTAWPAWGAGLMLASIYLWHRLGPLDAALGVLRSGGAPARPQVRAAARALEASVVLLVAPMVAGVVAAVWLGLAASGEAAHQAAVALTPCLAIGLVTSLWLQRLVQPAVAALGLEQVPTRWRFGLRPRLVIGVSAVAALCCGVVILSIDGAIPDPELTQAWRAAGRAGTGLAVGFVCLVAGLAGGLFATGMHRRVAALTRRLEQMASGSQVHSTGLPVASTTEVGAMAAAYNRLAEGLADERRLLARHTEKVRHAERVRAKFLRTMSHELRTPLNSIIGFSDLLAREIDGSLNERQREGVEVISRSGARLLEMINDILLMAQFEADRAVLDASPTNLAGVVEEAVAQVGDAGDGLEVRWEVDSASCVAEVDGAMITRAVAALVAHVSSSNPEERELRILRADTGDLRFSIPGWRGGCSPEETDRLLDGFRRSDLAGRTQAATIDLGLPLARAIARLHGGELEFVPHRETCWIALRLPADRLLHEEDA